MKLYLQNMVNDISFEKLPTKWHDFDFIQFSTDKTHFNFQKHGLQNALKGLWLYYSPFQKGWQSEVLSGYLNTPPFEHSSTRGELFDTAFIQALPKQWFNVKFRQAM